MPEHDNKTTVEFTDPLQTTTQPDIFKAIESNQVSSLKAQLEETHPQYQANKQFWVTMGDVALNRILTAGDKKQYLVKGRSEQQAMYDQRVDLSTFIPETPGLISDFIGSTFSKVARRSFARESADELNKSAGAKVDPTGQIADRLLEFQDEGGDGNQTLNDTMRRALELALTYGSVDFFLDHPTEEENQEGTPVPSILLLTP